MEATISQPHVKVSHTNRFESSSLRRGVRRDLNGQTEDMLRDMAYVYQLSRRVAQEIVQSRKV